MSKKHFSSLLLLTLIVAVIILLLPGKTGNESAFQVRPLIAGMGQWVNDVKRVRFVKAGNETVATLVRAENGWLVEDAESYPADWVQLKTLLAAISRAEVIEPKTSNAAYFDRLGLVDVTDDSSKAVLVEIGEGENLTRVLVGNAAQGRPGQYVRLLNEDQALMVDQTLEVAMETRDWLLRNIIDLSEAEVVEVKITHPDGEEVKVQKNSADDQDFTLLGLPEGREINSSYSVNSLGGALSGLQLDEVGKHSSVDWSQATHLVYLTADGLEVSADFVKAEEKSWLKLTASAHLKQTPSVEAAEVEEDEEAATETETIEQSATEELDKRVEEINQRVSAWAYVIPNHKSESMNKRMEDLLKPLTEE